MPEAAVEDAKAIVELHQQYCRDGDVEKVLTNIAEDVVLVAADAPLIEGADAFREFYKTLSSMGSWEFRHDYHGAKSSGDMVFLQAWPMVRSRAATGRFPSSRTTSCMSSERATVAS